jgi:hypothetical protein
MIGSGPDESENILSGPSVSGIGKTEVIDESSLSNEAGVEK